MLIVCECIADRQTELVFGCISRTVGLLESVLKVSSKEQVYYLSFARILTRLLNIFLKDM
jgi:hypothetical protein